MTYIMLSPVPTCHTKWLPEYLLTVLVAFLIGLSLVDATFVADKSLVWSDRVF